MAPAKEAPLPDKLADDYRLFAALSSPSGGGLSDARAILPAPLRAIAPGTLLRLALLTGGLAQDEPVQTTDRLEVRRLSGPVLGAVVSKGTAMLSSWPTSFRRWTAERADRIADDREALRGFRSQLQRLTTRSLEGDDLAKLVSDALPDLGSHVVHAFASDQRYYLYKQVQKTLGLDNPQIDKLRQLAGPGYRCIDPEAAHLRGRFDAGFVERLKPIFGGALAFNACTGRLRLPLYGVEQLCDDHLLARVETMLTARGVGRIETGWCRNELVAEGILPRGSLSAARIADGRIDLAATIAVRDYALDRHAACTSSRVRPS